LKKGFLKAYQLLKNMARRLSFAESRPDALDGEVAFCLYLSTVCTEMTGAPDWLPGFLLGAGGFFGMYPGTRTQRHVPARLKSRVSSPMAWTSAAKTAENRSTTIPTRFIASLSL
jgi:hypothetical protein